MQLENIGAFIRDAFMVFWYAAQETHSGPAGPNDESSQRKHRRRGMAAFVSTSARGVSQSLQSGKEFPCWWNGSL